jgi:hypothetical protein
MFQLIYYIKIQNSKLYIPLYLLLAPLFRGVGGMLLLIYYKKIQNSILYIPIYFLS